MTSEADRAQTLQLPAVMDLTAAAPLSERFLTMRGIDLVLDASQVTRLGGQCLQVLLSAHRTWEADSAKLEVVSPSPDFLDALRQLGIDPSLFTNRELSQ